MIFFNWTDVTNPFIVLSMAKISTETRNLSRNKYEVAKISLMNKNKANQAQQEK
jgi:hypothetical protein